MKILFHTKRSKLDISIRQIHCIIKQKFIKKLPYYTNIFLIIYYNK